MFIPPQKPWLWTETNKQTNKQQKKTECTSSAIFGVRTAAKVLRTQAFCQLILQQNRQQRGLLESKFRNLNFLPSTKKKSEYSFELFLSIAISQVLNFTTVELKSLSLKKALFSKATVVMRFPAKKNARCPKALRDFPRRNYGILHPRRIVLGLLSPSPRVCTGGRVRTLTSQQKFFGLIGYQFCLAMVLRWRAMRAYFVKNNGVLVCVH